MAKIGNFYGRWKGIGEQGYRDVEDRLFRIENKVLLIFE